MKLAVVLATLLSVSAFAAPQYTKPGQAVQPKPNNPAGVVYKNFVYSKGDKLYLNDKTYFFAGSNTYYLYYAAKEDVDALFADARKVGAKVIRTWLFAEMARDFYWDRSGDPFNEKGQKVWFQRWNNATNKIEYNDSPVTGLGRFDYVLDSARRHGIKLINVMTNNWNNFGGVDWFVGVHQSGGLNVTYHSEFYTHPVLRKAYKNWVKHVITRKNKVNGIAYNNDPTIFAWELMNEARCKGWGTPWSEGHPDACKSGWNGIVNWADEMSTYIKSIAPKQMVLHGDEGMLNHPNGPSFNYVWSDIWNGDSGSDFEAIIKLKNIDAGVFHSYFDYSWVNNDYKWVENNKTVPGSQFGADFDPFYGNNTRAWISAHAAIGKKVGKPVILEEIGCEVRPEWLAGDNRRVKNIPTFYKMVEDLGMAGSMYWQLNSKWKRSPDGWYNGTDHHSIFASDPNIGILLTNHAKSMEAKNNKRK